ncbi:hypothetical protein D0809_02885 [Flavobacterium circumlabens]|uniref:Uncharacterized protein n=1 Tax=Flavobacterium circumlabens TaxID=2133765 RepID=A0A4Y7UJG9_9FLAO|nr:hypothetical protein [Flavobacterium circumlabens]TEB45962.1 hypothetical protein D0809_02885 [Flavobacterium circumlabens]
MIYKLVGAVGTLESENDDLSFFDFIFTVKKCRFFSIRSVPAFCPGIKINLHLKIIVKKYLDYFFKRSKSILLVLERKNCNKWGFITRLAGSCSWNSCSKSYVLISEETNPP